MDTTKTSSYMKKVLQLARDGKIKPGSVQQVHVCHEAWCPFLRDQARNRCCCNPEIIIVG